MTPDTINLWMSATKPLVAVAVAQLWERGLLDVDEPVTAVIPEFGANGKEVVRLRHLLTHTACLAVFDDAPTQEWDTIIQHICALPLEPGCTPGASAAYIPAAGWYILAEVVRRVDGRSIDLYLREELFEPLDMLDWSLGIDSARQAALGPRIGWVYRRRRPTDPLEPASELNDSSGLHALRPASNGRGSARELAQFYQMLLDRGVWRERRVLKENTVRRLIEPTRVGMIDRTFRRRLDWGLGFMVNTAPVPPEGLPYGFGAQASKAAFGHGGRESSIAFADPRYQLVVAAHFNGMPGEVRHHRRMHAFLDSLFADLGIG